MKPVSWGKRNPSACARFARAPVSNQSELAGMGAQPKNGETSIGAEDGMSPVNLLKALLMGAWQEIVVQGGKLKKTPDGVYVLSGLWIRVNSRWVEIVAVEEKDSFAVSVAEIDSAPVPEPSKMFRPPRQALSFFPNDCNLDELGNVVSVEAGKISDVDGAVLCGEWLSIRGCSGLYLNVLTSRRSPGFIEMVLI